MASPGATSISVALVEVNTAITAGIAAIESITTIKPEHEYALAQFLWGKILLAVFPIWIVTLIG